MESGVAAFEQWHAKQTHKDGRRISEDKTLVAAINDALEGLLDNPNKTVSVADVYSYILQKHKFGVPAERIDEHCLYESGKAGTSTKIFSQPKKNPTLRIVGDGVYALVPGAESYTYRQNRHG